MRATMLSLMTVVLIAAAAPMAQAQDQFHARQVDAWYARYLGRVAEPFGMQGHVTALCQGTPALVVEATILASPEYFDRNGCNDIGFVAALYRDVLGVAASPQQIQQTVRHMERMGNREAFTIEFLQTHRGSGPIPVAPVAVQSYRQVYVAPAPVYRPIAVPAPVYRPAYGPGYGYGYNRPTSYGPAVSVGVRNPNFGFGVTVR